METDVLLLTPEQRILHANRVKAQKELQEALDKIVSKELQALTDYERGFLRARWTFLKPAEKDKFKTLLVEKKA